jgi:hypothetical protein
MVSNHGSANWFLDEIVLPTVHEFQADITDRRKAALASVVVCHLADYIYDEQPELKSRFKRVGLYQDHLGEQCESYARVRDTADATKHGQLQRRSAEFNDISQLTPGGTRFLLVGPGRPMLVAPGKAAITQVGVALIMPDGRREWLQGHIQKALAFLKTIMDRSD